MDGQNKTGLRFSTVVVLSVVAFLVVPLAIFIGKYRCVSIYNLLQSDRGEIDSCEGQWKLAHAGWKFLFDAPRYVFFTHYCNGCSGSQALVTGDDSSFSHFDRTLPTKIIIHGWLSSEDNYFALLLKDAYLASHHDFNVITVDWSRFAYSLYTYSRIAIHFVAPEVAKFVDFLVNVVGVDQNEVHILGHSLGAHIAGLAGSMAASNVSRITGMDPAMPLIIGDLEYRLDSTDAQFVDVIHTSIYFLGVSKPTGDADFYPNGGGPLQPGCGVEIGVCTHRRSYRYYIESIGNPKAFMALNCNSWSDFKKNNCSGDTAYMGEGVSRSARGKFYLRTRTEPPFGLGDIEISTG